MGPVENEDYVSSLLRFASGARGTLEASRVAVGEQNNYGFEIHGTKGAVFWDFRRMGELGVSTGTTYQDQPVSTVYVGPADGDYAAFQPGSAISMGYDDLKVIEAYNFLRSIAEGKPYGATAGRRGAQRGRAGRDGRVGGQRDLGVAAMTVRVGRDRRRHHGRRPREHPAPHGVRGRGQPGRGHRPGPGAGRRRQDSRRAGDRRRASR